MLVGRAGIQDLLHLGHVVHTACAFHATCAFRACLRTLLALQPLVSKEVSGQPDTVTPDNDPHLAVPDGFVCSPTHTCACSLS